MSWRIVGAVVLVGCNAVTGLDDLSFRASPAATVGAGAQAGAGPGAGGMGGGAGEAGQGGQGDCVRGVGPKRVFVSSEFVPGNFGGVRVGDELCQMAADRVSIGGCWRAYLSDASIGASDRICPGGPWHTMDGALVADDCTDLLDGSVMSAISRTESGEPASVGVWTGTAALGGVLTHCESWTTTDIVEEGIQGVSTGISVDWCDAGATTCNDVGSLYCFEL